MVKKSMINEELDMVAGGMLIRPDKFPKIPTWPAPNKPIIPKFPECPIITK